MGAAWAARVLADCNVLMIAARARAAPARGGRAGLAAAETVFAFVARNMTENGRLKHAWRHGRLRHPATLDDYAQMSEAALLLAETTGKSGYLRQAESWTEVLDRHYWDPEGGGYFLTADDTEQLIVGAKSAHDTAVPAGNAVVVLADRRSRSVFHAGRVNRGIVTNGVGLP